MANDVGGRGAGDVIARAISRAMHVPALDEIRGRVTDEEYVAILLLAGDLVQFTEFSGLDARLVCLAITAAAAMYAEGLKVSDPILGRGPGAN